jgi:hypothetical protein
LHRNALATIAGAIKSFFAFAAVCISTRVDSVLLGPQERRRSQLLTRLSSQQVFPRNVDKRIE